MKTLLKPAITLALSLAMTGSLFAKDININHRKHISQSLNSAAELDFKVKTFADLYDHLSSVDTEDMSDFKKKEFEKLRSDLRARSILQKTKKALFIGVPSILVIHHLAGLANAVATEEKHSLGIEQMYKATFKISQREKERKIGSTLAKTYLFSFLLSYAGGISLHLGTSILGSSLQGYINRVNNLDLVTKDNLHIVVRRA